MNSGETKAVSVKTKILLFGKSEADLKHLVDQFEEDADIEIADSFEDGLDRLHDDHCSAVLFSGPPRLLLEQFLESAGFLDQLPDGVALLSPELEILWCNQQLIDLTGQKRSLAGLNFYEAFGTSDLLDPDYCPFHSAIAGRAISKSTLHVGEKSYFEVHTKPIYSQNQSDPSHLAVIVRDISVEVLQRQKLNAIYQAGIELGDLAPQEILEMNYHERIELLKSKILHYTQDLLEFETVEIRLVDKHTKKLEPLLAVGMQDDAIGRVLYAEPQGHGVTGFVAATGKSYLCEDTTKDPLYLPGAIGAHSSLTVPINLHDETMGTFNVESHRPGAFTDNDLQFLELFSREVAVALNTLELLVTEKMTTATESTERILNEVANPVDEILNDAAWILEKYIGHDPDVCDRLQRVLKHTRDIKQTIQKVGEKITPKTFYSPILQRPNHPKLREKRILVVDADESVRSAAHELLGRYGCEVETAHHGEEAFLMVRSFHYDIVLADIRLPDMNGFECFQKLRELHEHLPVILMTGFGYDPTHSIVNARQHGLKSVLYKPFRLDQLISEVEKAVTSPVDLASSK